MKLHHLIPCAITAARRTARVVRRRPSMFLRSRKLPPTSAGLYIDPAVAERWRLWDTYLPQRDGKPRKG